MLGSNQRPPPELVAPIRRHANKSHFADVDRSRGSICAAAMTAVTQRESRLSDLVVLPLKVRVVMPISHLSATQRGVRGGIVVNVSLGLFGLL